MEGRKQGGSSESSSSSSFPAELFGQKKKTTSQSSIFSLFNDQPSKKGPAPYEAAEKKQGSVNTSASIDSVPRDKQGRNSEAAPKKDLSSLYQEQKMQPCNLSSSIYYGGRETYSCPNASQSSDYSIYKKDGEDDDGSASRGNWWQGSLYY